MCSTSCDATDPIELVRVLVAGYGNPLRRDDGVGWRVAEAIAERWSPEVTVCLGQQLVPEWAADLAQADVAFIVDASLTVGERLRLRRLTPATSPALLDGHTLGLRDLLALAELLYGRSPKTYLVEVPAEDLDFGSGLSSVAEAGMQAAIRVLDRRLTILLAQPWAQPSGPTLRAEREATR